MGFSSFSGQDSVERREEGGKSSKVHFLCQITARIFFISVFSSTGEPIVAHSTVTQYIANHHDSG